MNIKKFKNSIFVEKKMDKHLETKAIIAGIFNAKSCRNLNILTSCIGCNKVVIHIYSMGFRLIDSYFKPEHCAG